MRPFIIAYLRLVTLVAVFGLSNTLNAQSHIERLDDQFNTVLHEADKDIRDSLFAQLRIQSTLWDEDSAYVHYSITYVEDTVIQVSKEDVILIAEDLLFRMDEVMDSLQTGWCHFVLGMMNSVEFFPTDEDLLNARYHGLRAMAFTDSKLARQKYEALILYYLKTVNDSFFMFVDRLKEEPFYNDRLYRCRWYNAVGDYKRELEEAKGDPIQLITAFSNNGMYKEVDSLFNHLKSGFTGPYAGYIQHVFYMKTGSSYLKQERFAEAEELLQEALAFFQTMKWSFDTEECFNDLLMLYELSGQKDQLIVTQKAYMNFLHKKVAFSSKRQSGQLKLMQKIRQLDERNETEKRKREEALVESKLERQRILFISALLVVILAALAIGIIRKMRRQRERLEQDVTRMQLEVVHNQFKPHFLYNALSVINFQLYAGDVKGAEKTIHHLGHYMRDMLDALADVLIPLEKELALIEHYVELERSRLDKDFTFEVKIDVDASQLLVPGAITQIFVENALLHGIAPQKEGGVLEISVHQADGRLLINISDNGPGKGGRKGREGSHGLEIAQQRMAFLSKWLKNDIRLEWPEPDAPGTRVQISMYPLSKGDFGK